jgi:hypothetical protein
MRAMLLFRDVREQCHGCDDDDGSYFPGQGPVHWIFRVVGSVEVDDVGVFLAPTDFLLLVG